MIFFFLLFLLFFNKAPLKNILHFRHFCLNMTTITISRKDAWKKYHLITRDDIPKHMAKNVEVIIERDISDDQPPQVKFIMKYLTLSFMPTNCSTFTYFDLCLAKAQGRDSYQCSGFTIDVSYMLLFVEKKFEVSASDLSPDQVNQLVSQNPT